MQDRPAPAPPPAPPLHATAPAEALARLGACAQGLTAAEAERRLAEAGPNRLPRRAGRGPLRRLLAQFDNLLIHVLLVAAALSAALGHPVDAGVILAVVLITAGMGFIQEGRAAQALEAILALVDPEATVLRDGRRQRLPADRLVPGDVVLLEPGDRAPADLRLIRAAALRMDESALTGESAPVDKTADPVAPEAPLAERASMAFSGALVTAGQGAGVVAATGARTELGRVSALVAGVETLRTPLVRQMDGFARRLTVAILGVSALAFVFAITVRGYALAEAFMAMVGIAVAAIPEGLPAIMTITLAIGVRRMADRRAVIRRLPAVETLGAVSVICSDKTGTLTRNEMTAAAVLTPAGAFAVEGQGYAPEGAIRAEAGADPAALADLARAAVLCNDAALIRGPDGWRVDGDPMEGALVALAMKAGLDPDALRAAHPRDDVIPFDSAHRWMATAHGGTVWLKGAPERVLALTGRRDLEPGIERMAARGMRVLGFARFDGPLSAVRDGGAAPEFLGLVGFIDPPRPEAVEAVADCRRAGIRVVMITGDHAATARAIAAELGIAKDPRAMTGAEVEALDDDALRAAVRETDVFARAAPEHKLRLVQALQAEGLTVAMTGDGVNDAPALKRADVGVAMGRKGTEAAKEASDMVLTDDNFASITAAVREGRTVHDNLTKVIGWALPMNGGEALTILAAIALGLALPITPVQILWINMIATVALGLTLAFEPTEPGAMSRPPRPADQPLLTRSLLWRIGFVSTLIVCGAFASFAWGLAQGLSLEGARTLTVNAMVAMEVFYLFSARFAHGASITWRGALGTPAVRAGVAVIVVAQLAFTYAPPAQAVFGTADLDPLHLAWCAAAGALLLLIVEADKLLARRRAAGRLGRAG
ncbi:MAG: HAD-IC family P-type ATPase [Rubrimonas sp.]